MKQVIAGLLFVLAVAPNTSSAQAKPPMQIVEFGRINSEEIEADLDGVLVALDANPNALVQFVFSRGEKQTFGSPYRRYGVMKTYLLYRKVDRKKIVASFCQPKPQEYGYIWLVDANGARPECEPENIVINQTTLFDSAPSPTEKGTDFGCCVVDSFGPAAAVESIRGFADLLKRYPESKAYVFSYGGTNVYWTSDSRGRDRTVRNLDTPKEIAMLSRTARSVLKQEGISPSRIVTKNAGYRDSVAQIDLWIVPPGGAVPKPSPNYPKKRLKK